MILLSCCVSVLVQCQTAKAGFARAAGLGLAKSSVRNSGPYGFGEAARCSSAGLGLADGPVRDSGLYGFREPTRCFCADEVLAKNKPIDVLIRHEDHQAKDEEEPCIRAGEHGGIRQRPTADFLGDQEDHLAAVQGWNRQEVEDGQVDAQDSEEVDQHAESRTGGTVAHLENHDRTAQMFWAHSSLHQAAKSGIHEHHGLNRAVVAALKGLGKALARKRTAQTMELETAIRCKARRTSRSGMILTGVDALFTTSSTS